MRKKILNVALSAAIALFAGYNVHKAQQTENMSDIALANVEALANNEDPTYGTGVCFRVFTETDINDPKVFGIVKCNGCEHVWVNSINEGTRGDCGPIKG